MTIERSGEVFIRAPDLEAFAKTGETLHIIETKTGGPFRPMRYGVELAHDANNDLDIVIRLLEQIKQLIQ